MDSFESGGVSIPMTSVLPESDGPHPALLLLHGAGGNLSYWLSTMAGRLAALGMSVFAPHYFERTGTVRADYKTIMDGVHFPQWLEAACDAITAITQNSRVDARRIGVLGISLGGYIAMGLSVVDKRLAAVVELSGGMPQPLASRIRRESPPVLILHGEADTVVSVSEAHTAAQLLAEAGVSHSVKIFPGQGHWLSGTAQLEALFITAQFLSRHLSVQSPL